MLFNTPQFVAVLSAFLICWFLMPKVCRKGALLIFSYYYAWILGGVWSVVTLASVTLLTYFFGILAERNRPGKKPALIFVFILILLLVYVKFTPWAADFLKNKYGMDLLPSSVVSMVGVSYYVFSAISYVADVTRGTDEADRSLCDTAVWMAFFPKIIAGPIERHQSFKTRLDRLALSKFNFDRVRHGLLICARGYFYKMIIADRASLFVGSVYYNLNSQAGFTLMITMFLYTLQIYFDFAGYSLIAYGIAYAMDLKITKNFDLPYFSGSIAEFWRRWHISLSSWLRDYVYIPLGGNRKGKLREYINIMLTFLVSGVWHGTGLTFLVWGGLHGAAQILEKEIGKRVRLPKAVSILITFVFVSGAWIFFRADSLLTAKHFIRQMFCWNPEIFTDGTLTCFSLDFPDWIVLLAALAAAFTAEVLQYRGISLYHKVMERNIVIRWVIFYLIIFLLIVFGKYGAGFNAGDFIYYRF